MKKMLIILAVALVGCSKQAPSTPLQQKIFTQMKQAGRTDAEALKGARMAEQWAMQASNSFVVGFKKGLGK